MLNIVVEASEKIGLSLNGLKTETMVILGRELIQYAVITFIEILLNKCKYLGTILTSDGKSQTEIRSRIGQAKTTFLKMKNILTYQLKLEKDF